MLTLAPQLSSTVEARQEEVQKAASAVQAATGRPCCCQLSTLVAPTTAQLMPAFRHSVLAASCRRRSSASAAAVGTRSPWQVLASATATSGSSGSASASKTTPTSSWLRAPSGPLGPAAR